MQVDHKHVTVDLIDYWWGGIVQSDPNATALGPLHDAPTHTTGSRGMMVVAAWPGGLGVLRGIQEVPTSCTWRLYTQLAIP